MKNRFLLTGGPGAGKTSVLRVLQSSGCIVVEDSARSIIRTRKVAGLEARPTVPEFAEAILEMDCKNYDNCPPSKEPVFFDRGIADALGMCVDARTLTFEEAQSFLASRPYHRAAFFFPFWPDIYCCDEDRDQSIEDAAIVAVKVHALYKSLGFDLISVPISTAESRARFILEYLTRF